MRTIRQLAILLVFAAAACGGGGGSSSTSSSSSSPASTATGPASATLSFVGDTGLAGTPASAGVACNYPAADGTKFINVQEQPSDPAQYLNMHLTDGKIVVTIAAGSGQDYRSRQFEGTVTGFDAAKGAQIDTPLTDTTPAGSNTTGIGTLTSMKGSVDCGNQTVGATTVKITGDTAEGSVSGTPDPFRTQCTNGTTGSSAQVVGILTVKGTKVLFIVNASANGLTVFESGTAIQHSYLLNAPGVATVTDSGAHIAADVVEQAPASGSAHTLHVEGDITCGSTVTR
jgi:hypothetical protein